MIEVLYYQGCCGGRRNPNLPSSHTHSPCKRSCRVFPYHHIACLAHSWTICTFYKAIREYPSRVLEPRLPLMCHFRHSPWTSSLAYPAYACLVSVGLLVAQTSPAVLHSATKRSTRLQSAGNVLRSDGCDVASYGNRGVLICRLGLALCTLVLLSLSAASFATAGTTPPTPDDSAASAMRALYGCECATWVSNTHDFDLHMKHRSLRTSALLLYIGVRFGQVPVVLEARLSLSHAVCPMGWLGSLCLPRRMAPRKIQQHAG